MQQRGVLSDHGNLRAQALLRHRGNVLAVDQDAAAFQIEEAQQQVDQGRLAGTGAADQPDLLARPHRQGEVVDDSKRASTAVFTDKSLTPVAEAHVLEPDLAAGHFQGRRVRPVRERDRPGNRHHALLDHAHILEDRGDLPSDPAGDAHDLPGERQRHRHRPDLDLPPGP